jgi:integrase
MSRERKGSIRETKEGSIYARVTYTDDGGRRREINRKAENRTHARRLIKEILNQLEGVGEKAFYGERMRFRQLSEIYKQAKLLPAEYHDDRKVSGRRSWKDPQRFLETLVEYFGNLPIRDITQNDLAKFKQKRLKKPKLNGELRKLASIHRELEVMRNCFHFAVEQGWLIRSPSFSGLINKNDEVKRERTLSVQEELKLLLAIKNPRRKHLTPLVLTALDTAMRRGELFQLRWSDVDLDNNLIFVRATTTKTQTQRVVGITPRVKDELLKIHKLAVDDKNGLVFGITNTIKKAWKSACDEAGIENLRFHDLRHTAITRMVNEGLPSAEIMKTSGHTQMVTFQRYVNPTEDTARRNAERLANYNNKRISEYAVENVPENINNIISIPNIGDFQYSFNTQQINHSFIEEFFDFFKKRDKRTAESLYEYWYWVLEIYKIDRQTAEYAFLPIPKGINKIRPVILSRLEKLSTMTKEEAVILEDYRILFFLQSIAKRATKYYILHLQKMLEDTLPNSFVESFRNYFLKENEEYFKEFAKNKGDIINTFFQPSVPRNKDKMKLEAEDIQAIEEIIDENNRYLKESAQKILKSTMNATAKRLNASLKQTKAPISKKPFQKQKEVKGIKENLLNFIQLVYKKNNSISKSDIASFKDFRKFRGNKTQYITDKLKEYELDWDTLLMEALGEEIISKINSRKENK